MATGFVRPDCGQADGWAVADGQYKWAVADGRYKCAACGKRTLLMAGTLFDRRPMPPAVWFAACWMFAVQKDAVSALGLRPALQIGSYPMAWAMLHRPRSVLMRPGQDRLSGTVEADETGAEEAGCAAGGPGATSPWSA